MKSKQSEVFYGLSFFAIIVGVALLIMSLVNDFTSMHIFNQSPYVLSLVTLVLGGGMVYYFSRKQHSV